MKIHIHHWNRQYRLSSPRVLAWEQLAESSVRAAFSTAMATLLPNDREVIVIRNVRLKLTAAQPPGASNSLAEQWGCAMATAVHEAITANSRENVRRFADIEEQIAEYIEALLTDRDSDAWYFDRVRTPGWTSQADYTDEINAVIARHVALSAGILSHLSRRGSALPVLRRLAPGLRVQLWREGIRGFSPMDSRDSERPLFDVALAVVTRWSAAHGSVREFSEEERESAFRAYLAQTDGVTRWNDSRALTEAVDAVLVLLSRRFSLKALHEPGSQASLTGTASSETGGDIVAIEPSRSMDRSADSVRLEQRAAQAFVNLIEPLIQKLDWLDQATLRARLQQRLLGPRASSLVANSQAIRAAHSRSERWEQEWRRIETQLYSVLRATDLADEERCLMVYSRMIERHPQWGPDPGLHTYISRKIAQQFGVRETSSHLGDEGMSAGAWPSVAKNSSTAPDPNRVSLDNHIPSPVRNEEVPRAKRLTPRTERVDTECAGIFLLTRALHDLQILSLARRAAYPTGDGWGPAWLLARMAACWVGHDEYEDPGVEQFSRFAGPSKRESLFSRDVVSNPVADRAFQSQLALKLIGQRTWTQPDQLRILIRECDRGGGIVLGGDTVGRVYPWCAFWQQRDHLAEIVEGWQRELSQGSAKTVRLVVGAASLHHWKPSHRFEVVDELSSATVPGYSDQLMDAFHADHGRATCTASAAADVVLRHWAKSLQGVGQSRSEYLLQHLIRRRGTIQRLGRHWEVVMESRPLDAALRVSGLLDPLDYFTGQDLMRITFQTAS